MTSEERHAARRKRREAKRAAKRAHVTLEDIADLDNLHKAAVLSRRGVAWKSSIQRYDKDRLRNIAIARNELLAGNDIRRGFIEFDLYERGKSRHISSVHISERVIQKSISLNALVPAIVPSLTPGCSANVAGRGISYAMALLKKQLARHWHKYGSEGYILIVDFADYFATIDHGAAKRLIRKYIDDPRVIRYLDDLIDSSPCGLGLGCEANQTLAVALPSPVDHWAHEMGDLEACGRYMDDSYYIHESKEHLRWVLDNIRRICADLCIKINDNKTQIIKLSKGFRFLKKRISYSATGKIIVRPARETITRERQKLKALCGIPLDDYEMSYQGWRASMQECTAHRTILAMDQLYKRYVDTYPENERSIDHGRTGDHEARIRDRSQKTITGKQ